MGPRSSIYRPPWVLFLGLISGKSSRGDFIWGTGYAGAEAHPPGLTLALSSQLT